MAQTVVTVKPMTREEFSRFYNDLRGLESGVGAVTRSTPNKEKDSLCDVQIEFTDELPIPFFFDSLGDGMLGSLGWAPFFPTKEAGAKIHGDIVEL